MRSVIYQLSRRNDELNWPLKFSMSRIKYQVPATLFNYKCLSRSLCSGIAVGITVSNMEPASESSIDTAFQVQPALLKGLIHYATMLSGCFALFASCPNWICVFSHRLFSDEFVT